MNAAPSITEMISAMPVGGLVPNKVFGDDGTRTIDEARSSRVTSPTSHAGQHSPAPKDSHEAMT